MSREVDNTQGWLIESYEKEINNADRDSIRYIEDGFPSDIDLNLNKSKEEVHENRHLHNQSFR